MRHPEYSDEVIIAAGQAIQATGKVVTKYGLKVLVRGGDPDRLLAVWAEHEGKAKATVQALHELPTSIGKVLDSANTTITELLQKIANSLNREAIEAAEIQVTKIKLETDNRLAQAKQEQQDADSLIKNLQEEIDEMEKRNESLSATLQLSTEQQQRDAIEETLSQHRLNELGLDAQAARDQITVERERIEVLTVDRDAARKSEAELRTELRLKESRLLELENELDAGKRSEIELRENLGVTKGKADTLEGQIRILLAECENSRLGEILARDQLAHAIEESDAIREKGKFHTQMARITSPITSPDSE